MEETLEVEKHIPQELTSCNVRSTWDGHLKADFILINLQMIISLSFAHQKILIVASQLFSHGENHLDLEL